MKTTKLAGVSIWTWLFGTVVMAALGITIFPKLSGMVAEATKPMPLEIVKEDLWANASNYEVRGKIYNPRKEPARDVRIRYEIWGTKRNKPGMGSITKENGGLVEDTVKFIPAGATVDFTAVGIAIKMNGIYPDPLKVEIVEGTIK